MNHSYALTIFLFSISGIALGQCEKNKYQMGYASFSPYMYKGEMGKVTGLDYELTQAVFKIAGCRIDFVHMPWARIIIQIQEGKLDMTGLASKTAEREQYAIFSDSYRYEEGRLLIRKNETQKWPLKTLGNVVNFNMRIGTIIGAWQGKEFAKLMDNNNFKKLIINVADHSDRYAMLLSNRIDALLSDRLYMLSEIRKKGLMEQVELHPYIVRKTPVHYMFSKKTVPVKDVELINQALNKFMNTEHYKQLFLVELKNSKTP
ncbi:substrate-binding periplasmic protein [Spartinivicinus poritis]|uniref:Transporter substrate-binding domain-containing protein n=1 Tax=Spartinivicinus poritis TaxID=2994640 RepID=A0ABT5U6Q5_9GAMM|nr:transporter substrate-binding domain-containing protein [Spartinivicinus sp. A2-2]MDE1462041.1 transporter substrate-binding domain-containing protein [Spartinivicinus sp. A2-2]